MRDGGTKRPEGQGDCRESTSGGHAVAIVSLELPLVRRAVGSTALGAGDLPRCTASLPLRRSLRHDFPMRKLSTSTDLEDCNSCTLTVSGHRGISFPSPTPSSSMVPPSTETPNAGVEGNATTTRKSNRAVLAPVATTSSHALHRNRPAPSLEVIQLERRKRHEGPDVTLDGGGALLRGGARLNDARVANLAAAARKELMTCSVARRAYSGALDKVAAAAQVGTMFTTDEINAIGAILHAGGGWPRAQQPSQQSST